MEVLGCNLLNITEKSETALYLFLLSEHEECLKALRSVDSTVRSASAMPPTHPLYDEVKHICEGRMGILKGGFPGTDSEDKGWQVLAKQGDMTIYNREVESADGTYLDPLQVSLLT